LTQVNVSQKNFSGGEISPDLEGRTDLKVYSKGLSTSLNVMCTNKGDLIPRPGTEYVSLTSQIDTVNARAPKKARLIPFKISDENSYMLEFTDGRMKIFKDEKPLQGITDTIAISRSMAPVKSNAAADMGTVLETPDSGFTFIRPNKFPYDEGDGPFYFDFDQSVYNGSQYANVPTENNAAEISFETVNTSAPGKGTSTEFDSSHAASTSNRFWIHSVERNQLAPTAAADGINDRGAQLAEQFCDIVRITDEYQNVGIEGAELKVSAVTSLTDFRWMFENKSITFTSNTSTVSSSVDLDYFVSPYTESELDEIQFDSFVDSLFLVHRNHQPMRLVRTGADNFRFTKFYFEGGPWRESSTYGEVWQGAAKAGIPESKHGILYTAAQGRSFPFHTNGEVQWDGNDGTDGKNLNESGVITHIHLSELSPGIATSASGFIADDAWINRKVRISFNIGQGTGFTNLGSVSLDLEPERRSVSGENSSVNGILNEEGAFTGFSSFDSSTFIWAEGQIEKQRHIEPETLNVTAKGNLIRLFTSDDPGLLYTGSNTFLAPGDIIEFSGSDLPTHTAVPKSATEPNVLDTNQFYIHTIYDDTRAYICDSFAKIGVDGQEFSGSYTSVAETAGILKAVLRKHTNPTRQFRIKIIKPFAFTSLEGSDQEAWVWLKPSSRTKIGYLFEEPLSDGTGGWPGTVTIFDNRLFFASNNELPTMMAASAKGDFNNFYPDDGGSASVASVQNPELDSHWAPLGTQNPRTFATDSFTYSLQEGISGPIKWMKAIPQGLVVATANGIYMSDKPKQNETYGPNNWRMKFISEEGANSVLPEYIDGKIYYVNSRGDKLLSLKYSVEVDAFKPTIESILSEHFFKDGIRSMAFARSPIQVLWLILNNGDFVSAVMLDSEEQKALFRHRLAGPAYYNRGNSIVNSIAVIPSYDKSFDQLWMSVERGLTIGDNITPDSADSNGNFNTIEVLTQYSPYLDDAKEFVGLDLSVSYNSEIRRLGTSADEIIDLDVGSDNELTDQLKIETKENHGIADASSAMIISIKGGLSYLNHGSLYVADNASENKLFYSDVRQDPASLENTTESSTSYHIGTRHPFIKSGRVLARNSSIGYVGANAIGSNAANTEIAGYFDPRFNGTFFERGLKFLDYKMISSDHANGADGVSIIPVKPVSEATIFDATETTYTPASTQGHLFVIGFKQDIYFSSLPPVLNNQLGDMDLNYTSVTSATIQVSDSHQIRVRHFGDSVANEYEIIDDLPAITTLDQDAVRAEGRYTVSIQQKEEDTKGKLTFYPESGYPFRLRVLNIRGERSTRP